MITTHLKFWSKTYEHIQSDECRGGDSADCRRLNRGDSGFGGGSLRTDFSDEDAWRAYVPELEAKGAATWGTTKDEALQNIHEVAQMVIEELIEDGEPLPDNVTVSDQTVMAVNV